MTCHTTKPHSSSLDIVTYRYKDELVYVPISPSYFQALTHAREAFPQLKRHRDASLSLSLTPAHRVHPGGDQKPIGISAAAWPKLISHMAQYQVIDVHVQEEQSQPQTHLRIPDITITYADAEDGLGCRETDAVPPPYAASGKDANVSTDDEKAASHRQESPPRQRTQSTTSLQPRRSWLSQKLHGQFM